MNTPQTRRLTILNADEIQAIFGLPQFTEDERQMHFALNPSESEVVSSACTITAAVHLTLQIGYFKAKCPSTLGPVVVHQTGVLRTPPTRCSRPSPDVFQTRLDSLTSPGR